MKGSFYALYKPLGLSSFQAIYKFKKANELQKIGHMGTLDPLAEGVLPIATGEATRLIQYANLLPKEYICEIYFGQDSPSLDKEPFFLEDGSLMDLNEIEQSFKQEDVEKVLAGFVGEIEQYPPAFSAVQINGVRAYDLARKGSLSEEVLEKTLKARKVELFDLEILDFSWPILKLRLVVGSGFYVRSLVRDLAKILEVPALMYSLIRTKVGVFELDNTQEPQLLDWRKVLSGYEIIDLLEEELLELQRGQFIENRFKVASKGIVLAEYKGDLVSVLQLESESNMLKPKNNFSPKL